MRIYYALDDGLAVHCQTGVGLDMVSSLQNAIKVLVHCKEVDECSVDEVEVYPLGVTRATFEMERPLKPDDKLPSGSTRENPIFVHVPHEKQQIEPGERYLQYPKPYKADSERRMSTMGVVPRAEERPEEKKQPRRASMPTVLTSPKSEVPDYMKRKYFVKYGQQTIQALMDPDDDIWNLKVQLQDVTQVPAIEQQFYYNGLKTPFQDDMTLRYYGLQGGGFFTLKREYPPERSNPRRPTFVAQVVEHGLDAQKERLAAAEARRKAQEEADAAKKKAEEDAWNAKVAEALRLQQEQEEAERAEQERLAQEAALKAERLAREAEEVEGPTPAGVFDGMGLGREAEQLAREAEEEDEARRKAEEEAARIAFEEEERRKAEEEAERLAQLEWERKQAEAEAKRKAEEEAARFAFEEEERRKAEEEAERLAQLEWERLKAEEEAEAKRKAEEEAARFAFEEEERRKAEEEAERLAQLEWERNQARSEEVEGPTANSLVYDGMGLGCGTGKKSMPNDNMPGDDDDNEAEWARNRAAAGNDDDQDPQFSFDEDSRRRADDEKKLADADAEWARHKATKPFTPTPFDMSTQRCWYLLEGDFVPYYIRINGWERGAELKQHILETRRSGRNGHLLDGVEDISDLKLIPPGEDIFNGKELGPKDLLPTGTAENNPILVIVREVKGFGRELTRLGQEVQI